MGFCFQQTGQTRANNPRCFNRSSTRHAPKGAAARCCSVVALGRAYWSGSGSSLLFFSCAKVNAAAVAAFFASCRRAVTEHHMHLRSAATTFFAGTGTLLGAHRAAQLARDWVEASAFNVFQWIKPDENCLSDIFAH